MTRLNSFPSEIISLIIDHLDGWDRYKCIFLNKSFYNATSSLLKRLRVQVINDRNKVVYLERLALLDHRVRSYIRKIIFLPSMCWSDTEFWMLLHLANNLKELVIPFTTRIPLECIQELPLLCPTLTGLHFQDLLAPQRCLSCIEKETSLRNRFKDGYNMDLDCDTLLLLLDGMSDLKKLSIAHPPLSMLTTMTRDPDFITMQWIRFDQLTHVTLHFLPKQMFNALFLVTDQWHDLQHLSLAGDIAHTSLMPFLQSHNRLTSLVFIHIPFCDRHVYDLADIKHPGLTEVTWFDIETYPSISRYALKCLLESTPMLNQVIVDDKRMGSHELANAKREYYR